MWSLLLILVLTGNATGAQTSVRKISIQSGWGGLGTPQNLRVVVDAKNDVFAYEGNRVDGNNVRALVAALQAAIVPTPDPVNLGANREWLNQQSISRTSKLRTQFGTSRQQFLFREFFTDSQNISQVIPNLFSFVRMDDYPYAEVEITFDDGSRLSAETHSYYPFMLPWVIEGSGAQTFNADISRALSALLPKKAPNKERLMGVNFADELVDAVMRSIQSQWNLVGSEDRAGDALAALRQV